jgi:hypothetical protein
LEWRHSGSSRPKISECKNLLKKFSPRFLGSRRHPPRRLSSKGPNYQREVILISAGLVQLKEILKVKRCGQVTKEVLFLHDDVPADWELATRKKLAYLSFQYLDHPSYCPDLTPSVYHLFSGLKKQLKGRHFSTDAEVTAAAETCLDGQLSDFLGWLAKYRATG